MKFDLKKWADITTALPDRDAYNDPNVGVRKKNNYIDRFLPELREYRKGRLLDIGAGTGVFCFVCKQLGYEVLAVLSARKEGMPNAIAYKETCRYFGVPQIDFTWGTEPAKLEDNSFDVVNSQGMLGDNKVEAWETMLDDMLRVLKPGGILLLSADHESGTEYADIVNVWTEKSNVALIEYWRAQTTWKWKKLG